MDVITMVSTNSLIDILTKDFPEFTFQNSTDFCWSNSKKTIFINPNLPDANLFILHELGHAILGHSVYKRDVDLVKIERDAWEYARLQLAPRYKIKIEEDNIQDNLETYREWLHARSKCPSCDSTGLQIKIHLYRCLACNQTWRVNEARVCALRRYSTK